VFAHEDWGSWWAAAGDDPELTDLLTERRRREASLGTTRPAELPLSAHLELLGQSGFAMAGPVWQYGDSCVVVAVR
jgi:hypothetical protein